MSFPAQADIDLPNEDGDHCGHGETHGLLFDLYECRSGNGLYYRLVLGNNIEFDIHPDRVLLRHGGVRLEVRDDKIVSHAPLLEHHGDMKIHGDVDVTGTVHADVDVVGGVISLVEHTHGHPMGETGSPST